MELPAKPVKSVMRTALSLEQGNVSCSAMCTECFSLSGMQLLVSAEASQLMTAAAELFIADLASTGWEHCCTEAQQAHRVPILSDSKLRASLSSHEHFDFLVDLVPR